MKRIVFLLMISLLFSGCNIASDTNISEQNSSEALVSGTSTTIVEEDFTGNRISGGHVSVNGEYIYFANREDENKLYRMDKNGNNQLKLSDHPNVSQMLQIQFEGNNLYYLQSDMVENGDKKYSLYMLDINTNIETKLSEEKIYTFVIHEEKIYFSNSIPAQYNLSKSDLFKMDLNGENVELIKSFDYLSVFQISNDRLYVELEEGLAIMNLDGSESESKYLGLHFPVVVYGNNIYLISYGLSKTNLDVKNYDKKVIIEDEVSSFTIFQGLIYYATTSNKIYKTDLNGKNTEFVTDGNSPIVYEQYIFYYNSANELMFIKK